MKTFNQIALILYFSTLLSSINYSKCSPLLDSITDGKIPWSTLPKVNARIDEIKDRIKLESEHKTNQPSQRLTITQQDVKLYNIN